MNSVLHFPVIIGTAREGRQSEKAAEFIHSLLKNTKGVTTELIDIREHVANAVTRPPWGTGGADEIPTEWQSIVQQSDGLVIVVPEYNHSFPGELKILLDSLREDYKGLPVLLAGVSSGIFGGARAVEHVKPVLLKLFLQPLNESLYFPKITNFFDENNQPADIKVTKRATKLLNELREIASQNHNPQY